MVKNSHKTLMQDLVARVPRDWALETSVLESGDKGICTCDIEFHYFTLFLSMLVKYYKKRCILNVTIANIFVT